MEVAYRFKGLDLVDRVPEELWTKICNIVWEVLIKTITPRSPPTQKKCNKVKWLFEGTLQINEKRRDVKGKEQRKKIYQTECSFKE